jgi:hypothetical protein
VKYWEIIANKLSQAGWTWGYVSVFENGQKIYVVDAHRDDGKRFIIRSDELLTAFLELAQCRERLSLSSDPIRAA